MFMIQQLTTTDKKYKNVFIQLIANIMNKIMCFNSVYVYTPTDEDVIFSTGGDNVLF